MHRGRVTQHAVSSLHEGALGLTQIRVAGAEAVEASARAAAAETALQSEQAATAAAQTSAGPTPEEFESRVAALVAGASC